MKLPRYSLRTLFVLVTLAAIICAWVAYQLNCIRQRHQFLAEKQTDRVDLIAYPYGCVPPDCPWALRILGEKRCKAIIVAHEDEAEAHSLFPEADVSRSPILRSH